MTVTDSTADMLTMIRNANSRKKRTVDVRSAKLTVRILEILKREGFIADYRIMGDKDPQHVRVYLRYTKSDEPIITTIKKISTPGLKKYVDAAHIPQVLGGLGIVVMSTSRGVMTGREARDRGIAAFS